MAAGEVAGEFMGGQKSQVGEGVEQEVYLEALHALLHTPEAVKAITARAQMVAANANTLAIMHGAQYGILVQNESWTTRARAFAKPMNMPAVIDDRIHATLLKAAAGVPSDPIE